MTYTRHGHYITGTPRLPENEEPTTKARCGGPNRCAQCSEDARDAINCGMRIEPEILLGDNTANYQHRALGIVRKYVVENYNRGHALSFDVYVVWFCKTLQNWKALVSTTLEDGRYYEVTYNGEAGETYLDAYSKIDNVVIPD